MLELTFSTAPPHFAWFPWQALAPGSDTKLDAATLEAAAASAPSAELPYDQARMPCAHIPAHGSSCQPTFTDCCSLVFG